MSDPLTYFLEGLEIYEGSDMSDETFGKFVRRTWTEMKAQERGASVSEHTVINDHGFPVTVTVPKEG